LKLFVKSPLILTAVCYVLIAASVFSISSCAQQSSASIAAQNSGVSLNKHRISSSEYFVVFLVASRNLDYFDNRVLFNTVRYIDSPKRGGGVGHSWIYIHGIKDGREYSLEGGHSAWMKGAPGYITGVMNLNKYGYSDPKNSPDGNFRHEPNPISYLWQVRKDGHFQQGPGGHYPTFAAKVDITKDQFERIIRLIDADIYSFDSFSIIDKQCTTFVAKVAAMVGLNLNHMVSVKIDQEITVGGQRYRLWADPIYSKITFASPDKLETSLRHAVASGKAEYAIDWYTGDSSRH